MSGVMDNFSLAIKLNATLSKALDLDTPIDPLTLSLLLTMPNGTGSGAVSQMWHDQRTLGASATEDLDFAGSLTNAFGVTLTFATIRFVYIRAATTNTNAVQVTRTATTGILLFMADGDGISLAAGDMFIYHSPLVGKTVTAGSDDTLTITNSAGSTSVVYDIVVVGTD
jgi:hypothetical protein